MTSNTNTQNQNNEDTENILWSVYNETKKGK